VKDGYLFVVAIIVVAIIAAFAVHVIAQDESIPTDSTSLEDWETSESPEAEEYPDMISSWDGKEMPDSVEWVQDPETGSYDISVGDVGVEDLPPSGLQAGLTQEGYLEITDLNDPNDKADDEVIGLEEGKVTVSQDEDGNYGYEYSSESKGYLIEDGNTINFYFADETKVYLKGEQDFSPTEYQGNYVADGQDYLAIHGDGITVASGDSEFATEEGEFYYKGEPDEDKTIYFVGEDDNGQPQVDVVSQAEEGSHTVSQCEEGSEAVTGAAIAEITGMGILDECIGKLVQIKKDIQGTTGDTVNGAEATKFTPGNQLMHSLTDRQLEELLEAGNTKVPAPETDWLGRAKKDKDGNTVYNILYVYTDAGINNIQTELENRGAR
jgi:hypothetical protein